MIKFVYATIRRVISPVHNGKVMESPWMKRYIEVDRIYDISSMHASYAWFGMDDEYDDIELYTFRIDGEPEAYNLYVVSPDCSDGFAKFMAEVTCNTEIKTGIQEISHG